MPVNGELNKVKTMAEMKFLLKDIVKSSRFERCMRPCP